MNVLFLTLVKLTGLNDTMVYTDMLRTIGERGHTVYAVCPLEKKDGREDYQEAQGNVRLLHANLGGNYFHTSLVEKGLTLLTLEKAYIRAIRKHFSGVRFDLLLYSTPPITFNGIVEYVKKRDGAISWLLLKDIFPQNAVDMGMMSKTGPKGLLYDYFRQKEKRLYAVSDMIGCMSEANRKYVLAHNPEITPQRVIVSPNSVVVRDMRASAADRAHLRKKYALPEDTAVFVYGGNLGKPQGVDFIVECLRTAADENVVFLVVGDGTDYEKLSNYLHRERPKNLRLMRRLPKEDYDSLVSACDVGLIFLDHRFTIPNFPSRLLSYMQAGLPVLACTDPSTDVGHVITEGGFGWWCESNDAKAFVRCVRQAAKSDLKVLGDNGFQYMKEHYDVEDSVDMILRSSE